VNAAVYCRVSTDLQEKQGGSLPTQAEACLAKAREVGYETSEEYIIKESFTGASLDRPGLDKVRQWVRDREIEAVICYEPDRMARDFVILMVLTNEFEKAGVELVFVTQSSGKTPEDRMLFGMKGLFAEYERTKILDRTQRGRIARARQGKLPGGPGSQLYGYDYLGGKRQVNEQAELVRSIFRWFTEERLAIGSIASRLASLHIPSPSSNAYWSKAQIAKMLKNRAYIGETRIVFKVGRQEVDLPDATPAIISRPVFDQAQTQLKRNKELSSRNMKRDYLLRGYVFCQRCGRRYTGAVRRSTKGNRVKVTRNYRCGRQFDISSPTRCSNRIWSAKNLEAMVWEQVESVLSSPETVLSGIRAIEDDAMQENFLEQELRQTNSRLKGLDKEQEQLLQWALKGFPEETVVAENKRINHHRVELTQRRAELENHIETAKQATVNIQGVKESCKLVGENLTELSLENKRLALEALNIKIWIDGENVKLEGAIPITEGVIATTQLLQRLSLAHPHFL